MNDKTLGVCFAFTVEGISFVNYSMTDKEASAFLKNKQKEGGGFVETIDLDSATGSNTVYGHLSSFGSFRASHPTSDVRS